MIVQSGRTAAREWILWDPLSATRSTALPGLSAVLEGPLAGSPHPLRYAHAFALGLRRYLYPQGDAHPQRKRVRALAVLARAQGSRTRRFTARATVAAYIAATLTGDVPLRRRPRFPGGYTVYTAARRAVYRCPATVLRFFSLARSIHTGILGYEAPSPVEHTRGEHLPERASRNRG